VYVRVLIYLICCISQGNVATCLRCGEKCTGILLQIYFWVQQRKSCESRSTFAKVMSETRLTCFLTRSVSVADKLMLYKVLLSTHSDVYRKPAVGMWQYLIDQVHIAVLSFSCYIMYKLCLKLLFAALSSTESLRKSSLECLHDRRDMITQSLFRQIKYPIICYLLLKCLIVRLLNPNSLL